jgi:hypothetical protein
MRKGDDVKKYLVKLKTTTITYTESVVEATSEAEAWNTAVQENNDVRDEVEYHRSVEVTDVEEM